MSEQPEQPAEPMSDDRLTAYRDETREGLARLRAEVAEMTRRCAKAERERDEALEIVRAVASGKAHGDK